MKIKQLKNVPSALFRYFILIGLSFLILYPIFVTVMISLMQTSDFTNSAVRYLSLSPTLENYKTAAIFLQYGQTLLRSLALNIPLCLLEIVSCMLVAYGFARFKFKGNGILFGCVIMTLLIPSSIYFTPFYLSLQDYGPFHWNLLGTPLPLFLMSVCVLGVKNGLVIYILRQHFKAYPKELEEAAEIDGAGAWEKFWKITLPFVSPMILLCAVYTVIDIANYANNAVNIKISGSILSTSGLYSISAAMSWIYFFAVIAILLGVYLISLFVRGRSNR